jgi:cytoskeletal protein CcmA (bactofilin family)
VVEDYRTASYVAVRMVATCGDVIIEKRGEIVASVRAVNLTVAGKLTGDVVALGRVVIHSTGRVKGNIRAPLLRMESGAALDGNVWIGDPCVR